MPHQQMKNRIVFALSFMFASFLYGQDAMEVSYVKIDSIYGYRNVRLESTYSSLKAILGEKQVYNKHEYSCSVTDSSYLKMGPFKIGSVSVDFFDNKVRKIWLRINDSVNVKGIMARLNEDYNLRSEAASAAYIMDNNVYIWRGKKAWIYYSVTHQQGLSFGVIGIQSHSMECYVSKVLKEAYWDGANDEGVMHCPGIDPCDE
jgi:hypothetical protein